MLFTVQRAGVASKPTIVYTSLMSLMSFWSFGTTRKPTVIYTTLQSVYIICNTFYAIRNTTPEFGKVLQ